MLFRRLAGLRNVETGERGQVAKRALPKHPTANFRPEPECQSRFAARSRRGLDRSVPVDEFHFGEGGLQGSHKPRSGLGRSASQRRHKRAGEQALAQCRDAGQSLRMHKLGGNFCQRIEHKSPVPRCRMRDHYNRGKSMIWEIHKRSRRDRARAGSPTQVEFACGREIEFNRLQQIQQFERRQPGLDFGGGVQITIAGLISHGRCLVVSADGKNQVPRNRLQTVESPIEGVCDVAEIPSKSNVTARHGQERAEGDAIETERKGVISLAAGFDV